MDARERPDQLDRDTTGVGCGTSTTSSLGVQPWSSASDAGRRLEQEQTQAIIEVLAWLAALAPTATTGSTATTAASGRPAKVDNTSQARPAGHAGESRRSRS
jgi:hypothetical protein